MPEAIWPQLTGEGLGGMPYDETPEKRHIRMSRVKHFDTPPELAVRAIIEHLGADYLVHAKELPGKPDLAMPTLKKAIFVNGCFWHGHEGCKRAKRSASNVKFWNAKTEGNMRRDARVQSELRSLGWDVFVVWECQVKDATMLAQNVTAFVTGSGETPDG